MGTMGAGLANCMNVLVESAGETFGLPRAVSGTKEDVLPVVAAQDDVIQMPGACR